MKNSFLDEVMFNWSNKTPNKNTYLTRNQINKESLTLEMSSNSNFNSIKRKNISLKKTLDFHDARSSNSSKSSIRYSAVLIPSRTQDNSNNIYRVMLENVLRKNRTFNSKKEEPIFHIEKGKNEFKKKFNEIKNQLSLKKSYFKTDNEYSLKNSNLQKDLNSKIFLDGSLKKHLYIKQNLDEIFPKREKNFFSKLKIKVHADQVRENPSRN